MEYEVILLPGLYAATALAVLITLLRGITRTDTGQADDGLQTYRWSYTILRLRLPIWWRKTINVPIVLVILTIAVFVIPALVVTPPGHRGVIYSMWGGVSTTERLEGLSLVVPYVQTPHQVNVRTQRIEIEAFAQTADLQEVTVAASINYHVDPPQSAEVYVQLGANYEETVIAPAALQRLDAAVGEIEAEFFASSRDKLATKIVAGLEAQLGGYGIVIEYVNIEDALFDPDFIAAVKAKVIAKQTVETELRLVKAAEQPAAGTARAIEDIATAQAEANRLLDASLTPDVLLWQRILVWNGIVPQTYIQGEGQDLLVGLP